MPDELDDERRLQKETMETLRAKLEVRDQVDPDTEVMPGQMAIAVAHLAGLLRPVWQDDPHFKRAWDRIAFGNYLVLASHPQLRPSVRDRDNLWAIEALVEAVARYTRSDLKGKLTPEPEDPPGGEQGA